MQSSPFLVLLYEDLDVHISGGADGEKGKTLLSPNSWMIYYRTSNNSDTYKTHSVEQVSKKLYV